MPFKKSKRKPVRIESEESQAWSTPGKTKKLSKANQIQRDHANAMFEAAKRYDELAMANDKLEKQYNALAYAIPTEADIGALEVIMATPMMVALEFFDLVTLQHLNSFLKRCREARKKFTEYWKVRDAMAERAK